MSDLPRAWAWLLKVLPREFRERHGRDLAEHLDELTSHRTLRRWWLRTRAVLDVLWVGVSLRAGSAPGRSVIAEAFFQDVRQSARSLRRDRGLSILATVIVGLGIASSATVFGVADTLLLRPLPFREPERLVFISNGDWGRGQALSVLSVQVSHLEGLRSESRLLTDVAGYGLFDRDGDHTLTGSGEPERLTRLQVTGNFFEVLGVEPALGRLFTAEETAWDGPPAALLPHGFWVRRFAADPEVVGSTLTIDDEPVPVIGVLPASFDFPAIFAPGSRVHYVTAFPLSPETDRRGNTLALIGRLAPGAALTAAEAEATGIAQRNNVPRRNRFRPRMRPLREQVVGEFGFATRMLMGAVSMVMLIVCVNLSNLLLARGAVRQKEHATRAALGAGRGRLVRQMLVESLLLAGAGAALGLVLTIAATRWLASLEVNIPLLAQVRVDAGVLGFAVLAALLTGFLCGIAPALRGSGHTLPESLGQSTRGASESRRQGHVRDALVIVEVALACVLLIGAGLLTRSLTRMLDVDLGFQPGNAVALRIDPTDRGPGLFSSADSRRDRYLEALARVRAEPGVTAAGLVDVMPMDFNRRWCVRTPETADSDHEDDCPYMRMVSAGYLDAMGVGLVQGRDFTAADAPDSPPVAIVNEVLAERLWPGEDAIGRTLLINSRTLWEIVGVVRGMRYLSVDQAPGAELFLPMGQTRDYSAVHLVARGAGSPGAVAEAVRRAVTATDPAIPTGDLRVIGDIVDRSLSPRRFTVLLLGGFAGFALVLAALGIYGVVSYSVARRRQEIGIRLALGASAGGLRARVLADTLALAGVGAAIGVVAAWALGRTLQGLLFEVSPADPLTLAAVPMVLAAVAALSGYLPARDASRVDPVETLSGQT